MYSPARRGQLQVIVPVEPRMSLRAERGPRFCRCGQKSRMQGSDCHWSRCTWRLPLHGCGGWSVQGLKSTGRGGEGESL